MKARHQLSPIVFVALWMVTVCLASNTEANATAASAAAAQNAARAETEKGRVTVTQVCVVCHVGINRMLEVRKKSPEEWRETIYRMIGRGAQLFPEEIEPLTAYLAANAGRGRPQITAAATNQAGLSDEATAILARRCQQCHDVDRARTKSASADWNATIDRMIALGSSLTPGERQTLIEYLTGRER